MSLTKIKTAGVTDDAITSGKIPANAVGSSELSDNSVDTNAIQDQAVALSKLPHGDSNNNGKFLRANNGADPTFETVSTDLVGDTSPQLGGQLDSNNFDIKLSDGEKLLLHDHGSLSTKTAATNAVSGGLTGHVLQNSTILDGGSMDIWLTTSGKKITFGTSDSTTHEVMRVQCAAVGASQHGFVNLNYVTANAGGSASSATKLATTATGVTVTGSITDSKGDVRKIPYGTIQTSSYTLVASDAGKSVPSTSGGWTVPNNVFSAGDAVTLINASGSDMTITQASGFNLYDSANAGATGNRTLATRGIATIYFVSGGGAYITGSGLS